MVARRILVLDDDPDMARTLGMLLRTRGFDPVVCFLLENAIGALSSTPPDLLLSDWNLGGGQTSADLIVAACRAGIPVIALTGRPDLVEDWQKSCDAVQGYSRFEILVKPASDVLDVVSKHLA
ncbi:MAG: hypothetical protein U0136_20945 [Bdellovibrionota bacterium]